MSLITLMSDFGVSSPYVAQMKGVLSTRQPDARVVDLTHSIPAQNVQAGAVVLDDLAPWFPEGTVNIAVVDPGVGTDRRILAAKVGRWNFVMPDNGLLTPLVDRFELKSIVELNRPEFWLSAVSSTFHGRDIMSPVAAGISRGVPIEELGSPVTDWIRMDIPRATVGRREIEGEVIYVDSFGNLITNVLAEDVSQADVFNIAEHQAAGLVRTYAEQTPGRLVALIGSSGRLEFAVVDGSAVEQLRAGQGTKINIQRAA